MFKKCKYVLPLMLGVALVNSGYSMKETKRDVGVESLDETKINVFFEAIKKGNLEEVARLLESNPNYINAKDERGNTLLHKALLEKKDDIAELLIEKGADINVENNREEYPIHIALYNSNSNMAELLIEKGADINVEDRHSQSPLHLASDLGYVNIAKLLIDRGANRFVGDEFGYTPIDNALEQGNYDIVELLVNKGFDDEDDYVTRGKYYYGSTVLQKSLKNGYTDIARLLIEKVVDANTINAKDEMGKTPLDLTENEEIKELLRAKGAKKGSELN